MIISEHLHNDKLLIRYSVKTIRKAKQVIREVISLFEPIDYSGKGIIRYNEDFTGYYLNKKFYKLNTLEDVRNLEEMIISM